MHLRRYATRLDSERALLLLVVGWACVIRVVPSIVELYTDGTVTPYHSGGLYYAFVDAIRQNQFVAPHTIPNYTYGGVPFVYPPLAFYLAALVSMLGGLAPASILGINVVLSCASVVAFAIFVQKLAVAPWGRVAAVAAFGTMPQTFAEHLPGEGLAESLGTFCLLMLLFQLHTFAAAASWRRAWWCGVWLAANVLAAPGTACAAPLLFLGWVAYSLARPGALPRRRLAAYAAWTVACSLFVAAPYLLHVLRIYPLQTLMDVFRGERGGSSLVGTIASALIPKRADGPPVWHYLAIFGMLSMFRRKRWGWGVTVLVTAAIPRENGWLVSVPVAMLAGHGVADLIVPALAHLRHGFQHRPLVRRGLLSASGLAAAYAMVGIPVVVLTTAVQRNALDYTSYVTSGEAAYLRHLADTTAPDTTLLVIGNEIEWVPLLANRTVLNVSYGSEWKPDQLRAIVQLNLGVARATEATQVARVMADVHRQYPTLMPIPDLIYVSKHNPFRRGLEPSIKPALLASLRESACFRLVDDQAVATLFAPTCVDEETLATNGRGEGW
jgi:hypothetical protein